MQLPSAVLFDMDGLLVDTEVLWFDVQDAVMRGFGLRWTADDQHATLGTPLEGSARYILGRAGVTGAEADARWRALADELIERMVVAERGGVEVMPGAYDLLDALGDAGVPLAVVSNSQRVLVDGVLETLGAHRFATTVSATEVRRGKPDPEPYLTAAQRLGARPGDCVVVEDSLTGATAGVAAGCQVLAVPSLPGVAFDPRVRVVPSLRDVDLALLAELVARAA
ncbi:HAD family hydrolase [Vallicoccus soli]|uniref:HAD family phosphatase n=1 Tax=Vallicoccus soli TaxID=2339232 RepID=A0A3A3ZFE9_9ACTN|nr:HAD family phosphatase [Vallicoccus soli]RJK93857.1 HAD family phosphatase [Vallicoccus soli]